MDSGPEKRKTGKPGLLKRMFSSKKMDVSSIHDTPSRASAKNQLKPPFVRSNTIDSSTFKRPSAADLAAAGYKHQHRRQNSETGKMVLQRTVSDPKDEPNSKQLSKAAMRAQLRRNDRISEAHSDEDISEEPSESSTPAARNRSSNRRSKSPPSRDSSMKRRIRNKDLVRNYSTAELNAPLEFPCTPELILEHHKRKELLTANEEWLVLELNEFECLIDSVDVIKLMAKHSKFFEVEPPELVEEFFMYVECMPAYDEVLNNDIWLEFRDKKYLC